jgi:sugar phosphate isomerase/epimerase
MFDLAISQMTTMRWDLAEEVSHLVDQGIDAMAVWRPKMTDLALGAAGAILEAAGVRVSSVHWAGGFTGGDGRSFDESLDDALDAIDMAEGLAAGVVVIHSGCRGGHTRSHAARLLWQALEQLAPHAARAGVALAIKPMHAAAATCGSFLTGLTEAVDFVNRFDDPAVRVSFDLWHWADHHALRPILPRIAEVTAIVHVADRLGSPTPHGDRLPPGRGTLPLEDVLGDLMAAGFRGDVEFDPVGEAVEEAGYGTVIREARAMAAAWSSRLAAELSQPVELPRPHLQARHFFTDGASRSQASSQTVLPG